MAWLNKLNNAFAWRPASALAAVALASATLVGCNVGKTDTVATDTTSTSTGTTSGTTTAGSSGYKGGCSGRFEGGYNMPEHEQRIAQRNQSLRDRGIAVTGNDDIDNANAGGGPPDGGIWLAGLMWFETDANCRITAGKTYIFFAYEYDIGGTVNKDGTFDLVWYGQGSEGQLEGRIEADGSLSGLFHHPAPDTYVTGVVWGAFTPSK